MAHPRLEAFGSTPPFAIGPKLCSRFPPRPQFLKHV